MHKKISIDVSDTLVTATVSGYSESSTVIAASKKDDDILEAVKNAIDDVFNVIRTNDEAEKTGTAMVIIGNRAYRCYGTVEMSTIIPCERTDRFGVDHAEAKRKFILVEI